MPRSAARLLIVSSAIGLVGAGLSPLVAASPSLASTTTSSTSTTKVSLHSSWSSWPAAHQHSSAGAINLSENGALQRYTNRSNSPRPATKTTSGKRVLTAAPSPSWLPVVTPKTVSTSHPGTTAAWNGLNEYSNGAFAGFSLEPPDQGLCAANGHVLEMINDVVRVYGPAGSPQTPIAYLNDFFGEPGFQFTTDPSCVYDSGSNRFFASELTLDTDPDTGNLTGNTWLDLAVSKSGDPTAGFNIYRINVTDDGSGGTPAHNSCPCIGDFPHVATDANGVYLTTNEYPFEGAGAFGNGFNGAQIYALSKRVVVNGGTSVHVVHLSNVRVPSTSGARRVGFTLWPAQTTVGSSYPTANGGTQYFVSSLAAEEARPDDFSGHASQIGSWWLTNTSSLNTTPKLTLHVKLLNVGSYGIPPTSNQKAGPVPLKDCLNVNCAGDGTDPYAPEEEGTLDSSDTRPLTAVYANGSVYSALDTAMQVSGNVQAGFEWFDLTTNSSSTQLAKKGYFGVAHGNAIFPAIATNASGHGYISYTLSGDNWYPSAAYSTFAAGPGSSANISGVGAAPEDGFCEYLFYNCGQTDTPSIRPRWGDYGFAAWTGQHFYVANEFIARSCSYATFVNDSTCGGTRTFYGNFATRVTRLG